MAQEEGSERRVRGQSHARLPRKPIRAGEAFNDIACVSAHARVFTVRAVQDPVAFSRTTYVRRPDASS